jgi:RNA polymerase sigma-70 factor (ECF subfamily)
MDPTDEAAPDDEQRFREFYDATYLDLLRFARRRVHATHAEDVVADVMLVAWRRLDDVPAELPAARAWLFGVARKTLQNTRRREGRRDAVAARLAGLPPALIDAGLSPDLVADRLDIAAVWPRLNAVHQEALALAALDELSAPEAAVVLGISPTAFRLRLSRARKSLKSLIADSSPTQGRTPSSVASERSPR